MIELRYSLYLTACAIKLSIRVSPRSALTQSSFYELGFTEIAIGDYTDWAAGEPQSYENSLAHYGLAWYGRQCVNTYDFICEGWISVILDHVPSIIICMLNPAQIPLRKKTLLRFPVNHLSSDDDPYLKVK